MPSIKISCPVELASPKPTKWQYKYHTGQAVVTITGACEAAISIAIINHQQQFSSTNIKYYYLNIISNDLTIIKKQVV